MKFWKGIVKFLCKLQRRWKAAFRLRTSKFHSVVAWPWHRDKLQSVLVKQAAVLGMFTKRIPPNPAKSQLRQVAVIANFRCHISRCSTCPFDDLCVFRNVSCQVKVAQADPATLGGRRLTCAHKIDSLVHTTLGGGVMLGKKIKKRVGSTSHTRCQL